MSQSVKPCDLVQIIDQADSWYPAILIVHEVKTWGVQACLYLPKDNAPGSHCEEAWKRLRWDQIQVLSDGEARIVPFAPTTAPE